VVSHIIELKVGSSRQLQVYLSHHLDGHDSASAANGEAVLGRALELGPYSVEDFLVAEAI
jgi:hypothetical protein